MILQKRTKLFVQLFFIALFFVAAPYAIIKMLGLVIDLKHMRLAKAGSIYVRFLPRTATLAIDGEPDAATASYLNHDIYVPGLAPDTYDVSLSLKDYSPWQKQLQVESGKVTFANDIILWPDSLPAEGSSTAITTYVPVKNGLVTNSTSSALSFKGTALKGNKIVISSVDSPYVVTQAAGKYYFTDLDAASVSVNITDLFASLQRSQLHITPQPLRTVIAHPFTKTKLIIGSDTAYFTLDMKKNEIEQIFKTNGVRTYATNDSELLVVDKKGVLTVANLVVHSINTYPAHLGFAVKMVSDAGGNRLLLEDENRELYIFDRNAQILKKLTSNIAYYTFSPDGKRAVYISTDGTMRVLYLVEYEGNTLHKMNDVDIIYLSAHEDPRSFAWIPFAPNYFLMQSGDRLLAEEFDARPPHNVAVLAKNITSFTLTDYLYLLHTNKTLTWGTLKP